MQEGEFEPVGSSETIKINVRVIAATNRNLFEEIKKGNFREDLYYRLNVYPLTVPPLRERGDDIIKLAELFAQKSARKIGIKLFPLSLENKFLLKSYKWPGNVRELQNIIERGVITSTNGVINLSHLITHSEGNKNKFATPTLEKILSQKELLQVEKENIIRALSETGWKISGKDGAASLIGVPASTLSSRIKALKIKRTVA